MPERVHVKTSWAVLARAGIRCNHCVPVAFASALSVAPENPAEVADRLPGVIEKLRPIGLSSKGSWSGNYVRAARALGLDAAEMRKCDLDREKVGYASQEWHPVSGYRGQYRYRDGYPTVAQWVRRNPDVGEAILRGTGHAGYVRRYPDGTAKVFNIGARKRVDRALVIRYCARTRSGVIIY